MEEEGGGGGGGGGGTIRYTCIPTCTEYLFHIRHSRLSLDIPSVSQ